MSDLDPEMDGTGERRRYARRRMVRPLRVLEERDAKERIAISQDVSRGGLCFRARRRYSPGDRLTLVWSSVEELPGETWRQATVVRSWRDRSIDETLFPCRVAVAFDLIRVSSAKDRTRRRSD